MFNIFHECWVVLKVQHELEEVWIGMAISSCHLSLLPAHLQAIDTSRETMGEKQSSVNGM